MTRRGAGYLTDDLCPTKPEHGRCQHMGDGNYWCPHHEHKFPIATQAYWHPDEWEAIKSLPTPDPAPANVQPQIEKKNGRRQTRNHRRSR